MGWLKDTQAQALHAHVSSNCNSPDVDFYDTLPDGFIKQDIERQAIDWQQYCEELEDARRVDYQMALQVVSEISERDCTKPKRGPKPCIYSYKKYKRSFLSRWAKFISESASNFTQSELASTLGFLNKKEATDAARQFRIMKSGAADDKGGGHYRCTPGRFNNDWIKITRENGWHRRGALNYLWPLGRLMSAEEFEEWAKGRVGER